MKNVTIAIWGNPGSGKGTLAAAIAHTLTKETGFRAVLLASSDAMTPAFAIWGIEPEGPRQNDEVEDFRPKSIAGILSYPDISDIYLRQRTIIHPGNKSIGLMGYFTGESIDKYDRISGNAAQSFLLEARHFSQVTMIDCAQPQTDQLTLKAIADADLTIVLLEPNARGEAFYFAQRNVFERSLTNRKKRVFVASKVRQSSPVEPFETATGIRFDNMLLPFTFEAVDRLDRGDLFAKYKEPGYQKTVDNLASQIREASE